MEREWREMSVTSSQHPPSAILPISAFFFFFLILSIWCQITTTRLSISGFKFCDCLNSTHSWNWSLSVVSDSASPWTIAHQAPLSIGILRQEYWSGLPFPSPGNLPDPGIKPGSPTLQADALPSEPSGKLRTLLYLGVVRHMLLNLYWELRKTVGSRMADNRMSLGLM